MITSSTQHCIIIAHKYLCSSKSTNQFGKFYNNEIIVRSDKAQSEYMETDKKFTVLSMACIDGTDISDKWPRVKYIDI